MPKRGQNAHSKSARTVPMPKEALTRIEDILNKVRSFAYEPNLLREAAWLVNWAEKQKSSLGKYRALSLAIEIYNEYGHSDRSKIIIQRFKGELEKEITNFFPSSFEELSEDEIQEYKKQLKQVCWVYAGAAITHYWHQESQEGLKWIQDARTIIDQIIEENLTIKRKGVGLSCYGIQARLSYYAALLYIQIKDIENAEENLRSSLEFASKRYSEIEEQHKDEKDYWESLEGVREARYTSICVAKIQGYGISMIHQLCAELKKAEFLLESAELVLRQSQSPTMAEMIRLRLFKVRRALAGRDVKKLNPIIRELKSCYIAFAGEKEDAKSPTQNRFYASLSSFEIGLSDLYKAQGLRHRGQIDSDEYKEALKEARSYAEKIGKHLDSKDTYWEFLKELLLSQIEREEGNPQEAKNRAEHAYEIAQAMNRSDLIVEAYIRIGEALLKLNQPAEALGKFEYAEKKNKEENKDLAQIRAVCWLRKAEAYVELNKKHEALRMLDEWKLLSNQIEFQVIHYIAKKVSDKIKDFIGDFQIDKETKVLNLGTHTKKLRAWLVTLVLKRHGKKGDEKTDSKWKPEPQWLVEDMGISLSLAYRWLTDIEGSDWKRKKSSSKQAVHNTSPDP